MRSQISLLEGPILGALVRLALPITATSLLQMAYNLTDMLWIGKIGSGAVAAVGAAGMFVWFTSGLSTLARVGGQVMTAQCLGSQDREEAVAYARNALQLTLFFGLAWGMASLLFAEPMIGFFRLNSPRVVMDARIYLQITCGGIVFSFVNQILTGLLTARGNSLTPFLISVIGLAINVVLDPVLIYGLGPFPRMEVAGAAAATLFAQMVVTGVYYLYARQDEALLSHIRILKRPGKRYMRDIVRIGLPSAVQTMIFSGISMVLARMIAGWGDAAVAAQKVGSQVESISWMTVDGFAGAVSAFTAQNYGAQRMDRVRRGYRTALGLVVAWGVFCTVLLVVFPDLLFRLFLDDPKTLEMGVDYLRVMGYSQILMCCEIATSGAFSGMGKTLYPSVCSVCLTAMRIPLAWLLTSTALGLGGIWWSISISAMLKGAVLLIWFRLYLERRFPQSPRGNEGAVSGLPAD